MEDVKLKLNLIANKQEDFAAVMTENARKGGRMMEKVDGE